MAEFLKTAFGSAVTETFWLKVYSLAWRVVLCAALAIITIQAVKIIKKALKKAFKKVKVDDGIAGFLTSLICVGIYIVVGFIIAQSMGIDAASIVALLGSAGVTVGLAIQGSLANIAGGVLILILKPFKVGDYIIENSHSNEGTVIEIGLIYTKLNTIDNRTVILPNGTLANSSIVNVTQTPYRMIDLKLDIAYSADLQLAKDTIAKVLEEDKDVLSEKPVVIAMESWEASSIRLCARFYVLNENFLATRFRVRESIKLAFDEKNIEIPFTQVVVHKPDGE
ncbi:small conductance mechanosensitive channel [Lachnospiraceae bacterium G41]|nr:small conductance mechanosensitive channel [Lachnospiraceae bacterium G41]